MPIPHINWRITGELGTMERYLDQLYSLLINEKDQIEAALKNAALQLPPEERDEFEASNWGEISEIANDYPNLLYTSFLLSWYSFVESSLFLACRDFELKLIIEADERDNLGKGIFRAYKFIKVGGNHEINSDIWNELVQINQVRNSIVHDQGSIRTLASDKPLTGQDAHIHETTAGVPIYVFLEPNLYQYSVTHDLIRYRGPQYYFQPNIEFCRHLIEFANDLFKDVYSGLAKK